MRSDDSRISRADRPRSTTIGSASPTNFASKAKDLQALRDAVVDAAMVGGSLWLSYLFVFFYLAIAAGSVTHKDLFLENPVKLPFLNVDLPLLGFFILGPLLFLIVHAYTLLHLVLLAGKVGAFDTALQEQVYQQDTQTRLRRQLPSNILVQFLAGPREVRTGVMGLLLRLIALISLVLAPIVLLVFFQFQFLPYHDPVICWWQRIAVLIDLALLWVLWPSIVGGTSMSLQWRDFRRGKVLACFAASLLPLVLVFTIATFPGERLENLPSLRLVPTEWPKLSPESVQANKLPPQDQSPKIIAKDQSLKAQVQSLIAELKFRIPAVLESMKFTSMHELLVAGKVDPIRRRPASLWSNRLVLPGIDVIDRVKFDTEAKVAALPTTVSLRGRRLEGAVLAGAKLRKADFTGAQLQNASLADAELRQADFSGAQLQKAVLIGADLIEAKF